jgi:hypothetical protein
MPACQIADRVADLYGRAVGEPGEIHHAGLGLDDEVVAGAMGLGARLAETRHRAVHELRVESGERAVAEAELVHRAGAEILEQHVALLGELSGESPAPPAP